MATITLKRINNEYGFDSINENGNIVKMDSSPEMCGLDYGARPMHILLNALAGCASIDVISILKKQRQEIIDYKVMVNGERESNAEPSLWKTIEIIFEITGNVDEAKVQRAVEISLNKYCSVAITLVKAGATITSKIIVRKPK